MIYLFGSHSPVFYCVVDPLGILGFSVFLADDAEELFGQCFGQSFPCAFLHLFAFKMRKGGPLFHS